MSTAGVSWSDSMEPPTGIGETCGMIQLYNVSKAYQQDQNALSLLGGKGTLWGPVIGAALFHAIKEVTWTELLGWQWVALGVLIIVNIVYFQQGIVGWMEERWPELFGITVEEGIITGDDIDLAASPTGREAAE